MTWLPLKGIKVVDFSALIPGPFATAILADLGADVIKVEPRGGDSGRSLLPAVFHATNRNKLSFALDDIERILRSASARGAAGAKG